MATAEKLTGLRKAAILLICLGEETAARILRELSDEEIFKVTRTMAGIEHIPEDVRRRCSRTSKWPLRARPGWWSRARNSPSG